MEIFAGVFFLRSDSAKEVKLCPKGDTESAAIGSGLPDCVLCILAMIAGQLAGYFTSSETQSFRE
jgi:hypothetical protein